MEELLHEQYGISEKDLNFIHEYIACNFNASKAYLILHPNVKDTTAATQGSLILRKPKVQAAYREELRFHFEYMGVTSQLVLNELKSIANSDITDYIEQDGNDVSIKRIEEFKNSKVIKKISIIPTSVNMGNDVYEEKQRINIELHDKLKALQLMGDALGLFRDSPEDGDSDETEFDVVDSLHGKE